MRSATVEGWLVAVPQSSQVVSPAGYGWGDGDRALKEVCGHYRTMVRDYPVDLNRVVVGGFSQGGTAAISMALSGSVPVRGILGIACAPRSLDEVREAIGGTSVREMRLYLLVGDKDHVLERATDFAEILKSAGMTARLDIRPALGHELPDDFGRSLVAALEFLGS